MRISIKPFLPDDVEPYLMNNIHSKTKLTPSLPFRKEERRNKLTFSTVRRVAK